MPSWEPLFFIIHNKGTRRITHCQWSGCECEGKYGHTPLDGTGYNTETADLLRKHGGKTKKELEAAGN
jgi:hypothetical protein